MIRNNDNLRNSLVILFNRVKSMPLVEQERVSNAFRDRNLKNSFCKANSYEHPAWKDGLDKHGFVPGSRNAQRYGRMESMIDASEDRARENRQRKVNTKPKGGLLAQLFSLNRAVSFAY